MNRLETTDAATRRVCPDVKGGPAWLADQGVAAGEHGFVAGVWRRVTIVCIVWVFLLRAWGAKSRLWKGAVPLPSVANVRWRCPLGFVPFLVARTDEAVRLGAIRTGRKCFFRAYVLAATLRKHGVCAVLNMGLRKPPAREAHRRIDGHCWVTVDDAVLAEADDPQDLYPVLLGEGGEGVRYWSGSWEAHGGIASTGTNGTGTTAD